ncbi:MAG: DUF805 domain-containing protein [Thermoguttaceae bacterium]|nr:DUF805 domain-containing protein [Thermoguttaceae bacterium]
MKTCAKCGFSMDDDALYCARCGLYSGATVRVEAPLNFDKDDETSNFDKNDEAPLNFDIDDETPDRAVAPLNFDKDDETPPLPPQRRWSEESRAFPSRRSRETQEPTLASRENRTIEESRDEGVFARNRDASRRSEKPDYAPRNFADALTVCVGKKYCVFRGRAGRSEYWLFFAWQWILAAAAALFTNGWPALALIVPGFAALSRRLRDADYSARYLLWAAVPIVGWLVLLVLTLQPSTPGPNRFGPPSVKP